MNILNLSQIASFVAEDAALQMSRSGIDWQLFASHILPAGCEGRRAWSKEAFYAMKWYELCRTGYRDGLMLLAQDDTEMVSVFKALDDGFRNQASGGVNLYQAYHTLLVWQMRQWPEWQKLIGRIDQKEINKRERLKVYSDGIRFVLDRAEQLNPLPAIHMSRFEKSDLEPPYRRKARLVVRNMSDGRFSLISEEDVKSAPQLTRKEDTAGFHGKNKDGIHEKPLSGPGIPPQTQRPTLQSPGIDSGNRIRMTNYGSGRYRLIPVIPVRSEPFRK